jgi:hypothetical protein
MSLPGGNVAYTLQGIDGADGGFLYPSGNPSEMTSYPKLSTFIRHS